MPELTRRRSEDRQDCWHIYYGDVHAGTIAMRVGNPHDTDQWEWTCGFYPGSRPGEIQSDTAETFDDARAAFASAWKIFLSNRTDADFQAWRDQRDFTARKYALWDAGKRLEPPSYGPGKPAHRFRKCPCGEVFDMHGPDDVSMHVPHITATERGATLLVSVRRVLESYESPVIQERWPDSRRGRRCGRARTAPVTTAASCDIRAI